MKNSNYDHPLVNLPNTLETLVINREYNETLDMLPDSIEFLVIRYYDNKLNKLPHNLKYISISKNYKYKDDLVLLGKPELQIY